MIVRTLQQNGHPILLVTRDVELITACADQVVLLGDGEVVIEGPTTELLNDSLIFSSKIGKLFRHRRWLTVEDVLQHLHVHHHSKDLSSWKKK